jgi:hypothetical protein
LDELAESLFWSFSLYSGYNRIGDMGCKYLSRASLNSLKSLSLGNYIKMQIKI